MIIGTVTSQGLYKADTKEICELNICRESSDKLPHGHGQKHPISLTIGDITYVAGVHEKQNGEVWISSVLFTKGNKKEKARLVDALAGVGLKKGDKISLTTKTEAESFLLSTKA